MENWTTKTDEEVFAGAGEQPGSQASYWRDIEIKRRLFLLQKDLLTAQIDVVGTQKAATEEAQKQSTFMLFSTIGIFMTALITMLAAYISRIH
jgi:hypothetical protein